MNTFLADPEFKYSAYVLDDKRLGKQRLEVYQLLRTLTGETIGWKITLAPRCGEGIQVLWYYMGKPFVMSGFLVDFTIRCVSVLQSMLRTDLCRTG